MNAISDVCACGFSIEVSKRLFERIDNDLRLYDNYRNRLVKTFAE
jgi:hypothetical protein